MADFSPTERQGAGIRQLVDWYKSLEFGDDGKLLSHCQQVFRVFGYAGTGKTTLTKHAIGELGLDNDFVRYAAFTGKAAYVMRKHGTPAQTIHSLIYSVIEATDEEIARAEAELIELRKGCVSIPLGTPERMQSEADLIAAEQNCFAMKRPRFGLNPDSMAKEAELIVLDEVSMVGPDMAADLLSFGKPILVLGDPGQLPPIKGEGAFVMVEPDVMLTEVHRQAADSAIIRLATMAREGNDRSIAYGRHSDLVWKLERGSIAPEQFLMADQVICGLNRSRLELNQMMRRAAGFDPRSPLPTGGEKLICLKNDSARQLINGMFVGLENPELHISGGVINPLRFDADLYNEDGEPIANEPGHKPTAQPIYRGHFEDHVEFDEKRFERDMREKRKHKLVEATFGWAITCHKAQGSQWPNIIICDDHFGRSTEQRAQWLYTAITRAESGLVILD